MKIYALIGLIGAGKGTVGDVLTDQHFKHESFAGVLKDAVGNIFGWDREMLEGKTPESRAWRDTVDEFWATELNDPEFTPRKMLQLFGTEIMRDNFHTDIWMLSMKKRLLDSAQDIVITDARFTNEIEFLRDLGAEIIHVTDGVEREWEPTARLALSGDEQALSEMAHVYNIHRSEWDWLNTKADIVIKNDFIEKTPSTLLEFQNRCCDQLNLQAKYVPESSDIFINTGHEKADI